MVFLGCGLFNVEESSDFVFFLCAAFLSNIEDAPTEKKPCCLVSCCEAWPVKISFRQMRRPSRPYAKLNQEEGVIVQNLSLKQPPSLNQYKRRVIVQNRGLNELP